MPPAGQLPNTGVALSTSALCSGRALDSTHRNNNGVIRSMTDERASPLLGGAFFVRWRRPSRGTPTRRGKRDGCRPNSVRPAGGTPACTESGPRATGPPEPRIPRLRPPKRPPPGCPCAPARPMPRRPRLHYRPGGPALRLAAAPGRPASPGAPDRGAPPDAPRPRRALDLPGRTTSALWGQNALAARPPPGTCARRQAGSSKPPSVPHAFTPPFPRVARRRPQLRRELLRRQVPTLAGG
jgi:hypothetical protein